MTDWLARIAAARGVREVEVEQVTHVRATMASGYEQLAVESLEVAIQSQAQLNAHIGAGYATLALLEGPRQS